MPILMEHQHHQQLVQGNDIVMWANTQDGSQFLQDMLVSRKNETIMISKHGYYFFSKLIELVNDHQLQQIVVKIITLQPLDESLTRVSSNLHGIIYL